MVLVDTPLMAAESSSDSMLLAVPGSPTSNNPRFPASVMTARSTSASSPKNFRGISGLAQPQINDRTDLGESFHPAGLGSLSTFSSAASSPGYWTSAGARNTVGCLIFAMGITSRE